MYSVQVNVSFSFLEEKLFQLSSWLWDSQRTTVIDHSHFEFAIQFPVLSFPCLTFFSTVSDLIRFFQPSSLRNTRVLLLDLKTVQKEDVDSFLESHKFLWGVKKRQTNAHLNQRGFSHWTLLQPNPRLVFLSRLDCHCYAIKSERHPLLTGSVINDTRVTQLQKGRPHSDSVSQAILHLHCILW